MPQPSAIEILSYSQAGLGIRRNRAAAADAVGPTTIFTITGGLVIGTSLVAVFTALPAGALATTLYTHSVGPTNLNVATPTVAAPAGTIISVTGNPLDTLIVSGVVAGVGTPVQGSMMGSQNPGNPYQQFGMIMAQGTIRVTISVVTAGSTRYIITYIPLDDAAIIA